MKRNCKIVMND